MSEKQPHAPERKPEQPWTEDEKSRGAARPDASDAAGGATTGGRPTDDRAATESAAARIDPKANPHP